MVEEKIPLAVYGISHKTAPVHIREKVALSTAEQETFLKTLISDGYTQGALVLSTCNRTEIYLSSEETDGSLSTLKSLYTTHKPEYAYYLSDEFFYLYRGYNALFHFFKVISSLDSQIVGETQITSQVKNAYQQAYDLNATDSLMNKSFNYGIQAQKKVRTKTYLCQGAISISFAGVKLAEKIFYDLENHTALLVGAGETAELCLEHFRKRGVQKFHIANRTIDKAEKLARRFGGTAFHMDDLETAFQGVDIVISATSSQTYVINAKLIKNIIKSHKHHPLFLIDLAIPRDIDPSINDMDNVYLYNLDDLNEIVKLNTKKRENEIPKALQLIETVIEDFNKWFATYSMSSTISKLKRHYRSLLHSEIDRVAVNASPDTQMIFEELEENLTNKLLRQYVILMKKNGSSNKQQLYIEMIHNLMELGK